MFRDNNDSKLNQLPQGKMTPLKRLFESQQQNAPSKLKRTVLKVWEILSPEEIHSGTIEGIPIEALKQAVAEAQLEARKETLLAPHKRKSHSERVKSLKHTFLSERAERGEVRGTETDKIYIQGIMTNSAEAQARLAQFSDSRVNNNGSTFDGELLPELRKTHDRLPSALRLNFANVGSEKPTEQLQKRLAKVLEVSARVHESSLRINEYRSKGKPLGVGLPGLGDSAVVTHSGIRLFASGATKAQLADHDLPDMSVDWRDIAEGHVRVSLAPSGFDAIRNLWKRLRGRTDDLPATVLFTEGQHGRSFRVTMSGGRRFVEQIKSDARNLAQADFVPDEIDSLRKAFGPEAVDGLLKRLDNS